MISQRVRVLVEASFCLYFVGGFFQPPIFSCSQGSCTLIPGTTRIKLTCGLSPHPVYSRVSRDRGISGVKPILPSVVAPVARYNVSEHNVVVVRNVKFFALRIAESLDQLLLVFPVLDGVQDFVYREGCFILPPSCPCTVRLWTVHEQHRAERIPMLPAAGSGQDFIVFFKQGGEARLEGESFQLLFFFKNFDKNFTFPFHRFLLFFSAPNF